MNLVICAKNELGQTTIYDLWLGFAIEIFTAKKTRELFWDVVDLSIKLYGGPISDKFVYFSVKIPDLRKKQFWGYLVHRSNVSAKLRVHPSDTSSSLIRFKILDDFTILINALMQHQVTPWDKLWGE